MGTCFDKEKKQQNFDPVNSRKTIESPQEYTQQR